MYERPHVNVKVEFTFFRVKYISLSLDRRPVILSLWPRETAVARSGEERIRERVFGLFFSATSPRENKAQF